VIPQQGFNTILELIEDRLARAGFALVSIETAALGADIERRSEASLPVSTDEFQRFLYAIFASSYGDYHQAQVFA
jgi:hypothetical protein